MTILYFNTNQSNITSSNMNMEIFNETSTKDPFGFENDSEHRKVRIRAQRRNGRQSITTVQGLADDLDLRRIMKALKKSFQCNGNIIIDPDRGKVIQLSGDQRINVREFFIDQQVCNAEQILIAGA